jgi:hypothetical protein
MVRQADKLLNVIHPEVVPKVAHEVPKVATENLLTSLFDLDPHIKPESPIHIELDLDQLEEGKE